MASVSSAAFWTTEANSVVAPIHPKATSPAEVDRWLEADTAGTEVQQAAPGSIQSRMMRSGGALGELELGFVAPFHALDDITLRLEVVGEQQSEI